MGAFSQSKVNTRKDIRLKPIKPLISDYKVVICDEDMSYFYHKKGCDRLYYCSRQFIEIRLSEAKKKDYKPCNRCFPDNKEKFFVFPRMPIASNKKSDSNTFLLLSVK